MNETRETVKQHKRHHFSISEPFDFNNGTENIFSHPYISYMANEILQKVKQSHSKNYLLEMSCSHDRMRLKSAPQKLSHTRLYLQIPSLKYDALRTFHCNVLSTSSNYRICNAIGHPLPMSRGRPSET